MIATLVGVGIVALIGIFSVVIWMERTKQQRLERIAKLESKVHFVSHCLTSIPAQYLSKELVNILLTARLNYLKNLLTIKQNTALINNKIQNASNELAAFQSTGSLSNNAPAIESLSQANGIRKQLTKLFKWVHRLRETGKLSNEQGQLIARSLFDAYVQVGAQVFVSLFQRAATTDNGSLSVHYAKQAQREFAKFNHDARYDHALEAVNQLLEEANQRMEDAARQMKESAAAQVPTENQGTNSTPNAEDANQPPNPESDRLSRELESFLDTDQDWMKKYF